ncbi:MAG TPA: hypothetical protein VFS21_37475 [Roseiflexaceae bacterium]|nr:hypothetical protein [Roseiflexaceae bacterium]
MELQFLIMVDTKLSLNEIILYLKEKLSDTTPVRSRSFDWSSNWIQVWDNDDFDPDKISDPEDGFLYYPYRIEVSPNTKEINLEQQIAVARSLVERLEMTGAKVQVCADFEGML